jgi:uncharacterized coiled-coil protein SlyX
VQRDWRDERIAELEAELAAKDARIAEQDRRIAELEKRLVQLAGQLGKNSRNSHLPPSSDTPEERRKRKNQEKKARQKRKRGGQPDPARRLLAARAARGRDGTTAGAPVLAAANARSTAPCAAFRSAATCAATICSICLSNSTVAFVMHDPIARSQRLPQPTPERLRYTNPSGMTNSAT